MHIFGLVFILYFLKLSAGKGFMFLLHNDLPGVISIHHRCRCIILMHWLLTLNSSLFQLFCLVCCCCANHIMTCSTTATHVPFVVSCLFNPNVLAAIFEQVITPVICFLVICFLSCLLTRY